MEFRTQEQFEEICEDAVNGNWKDAGHKCLEYGFYANDLIKKYQEEDVHILDEPEDLALIIELANEEKIKMIVHSQSKRMASLQESVDSYEKAEPMLKIHWGLEEQFSIHEADQIEAFLERFSKSQEDNEHYDESDFSEFVKREANTKYVRRTQKDKEMQAFRESL